MNAEAESLLIPTTYSRIIARVLALQEKNLSRLLWGTNLPTSVLLPGDETHINVRQQMRIVENAQDIMGSSEFGLEFGRQLHPSSHGPLGYLVLSSPDLKTALESFAEYLPMRIPFSKMTVTKDAKWLYCSLELIIEPTDTVRQILQECFAFIMQGVIEAVLGSPLNEGLIKLQHARPQSAEKYQDYLHSPVLFGQGANVYQIPIRLSNTPNAAGDSDSYALAQIQCQELLNKIPMKKVSATDQVRCLLLANPLGLLGEVEIASSMFVSKRTLARRLKREGTSIRAINEKLRSELATRHLRDKALSIESIALILGYNDAAAFRKAFRRWYAKTPSQYRQELDHIG